MNNTADDLANAASAPSRDDIERTALLLFQVLETATNLVYPDEASIPRLSPHVDRVRQRYGELRGKSFSEAYRVSRVEFIRDTIEALTDRALSAPPLSPLSRTTRVDETASTLKGTPHAIERLWRDCELPEWFLGNGGSNHKLYDFARRCASIAPGRVTAGAHIEAAIAALAAHFGDSNRTSFTAREAGRQAANVVRANLTASVQEKDWRQDPTADERWNAGCDFAMTRLCVYLNVDPASVSWDAATESVDGDISAAIGNILRAKFGENWSPDVSDPEGLRRDGAPDVRIAQAYSDGQRDALADAKWNHDKAWQDALLMLVHYTDLDKRDARVTRMQAEKGRAEAWDHCLKLSATKSADDIAELKSAAIDLTQVTSI